jgi:hypothetical protein
MSAYPDRTRKDWKARPAVVIAPGPSLTQADVEVVAQARAADRIRVVSVSNAWKFTSPWADAYFSGDRRYWMEYFKRMMAAGVPRDRIVTCCNVTAKNERVLHIRAANRPGLGTYELTTGGNSGWMGFNLAYLFGARRILLLGFDLQRGPNDESHVDGDHPKRCNVPLHFSHWLKQFNDAAKAIQTKHGATVINCTRRTALKCFPMSTIEAELAITENA